ncbi:hypothetical protein QL093DRAFT_2000578, partial [Fusarium oxysporum]
GLSFIPTYHHDSCPFINPSKADLSGKRVLSTGASYSIGRAIAISFAKADASVIAPTTRSSFGELEKEVQYAATIAGRSCPNGVTDKLDFTDAANVEKAAREHTQNFDSLDIFINNAG